MTPQERAKTPDAALAILAEGNERFIQGLPRHHDDRALADATVESQKPHSAILACIDSRVAPEIVFDQGLGDIFCSRVPGNYASDDVIGGLEFATKIVRAKLIVVLGHTNCGAVMGACDGVKLGNLTTTLTHIAPAVERVTTDGERASSNTEFLASVTETNARMGAARIVERSAVIRELIERGDLKVVPALHDLASGRVTFFT